ncbi:MAG: FG-GAP-like repeat-containing protein [Chloroflexota bacterium]
MKTQRFVKLASPLLGLGLVVGLLAFLATNSRALAQAGAPTPTPFPGSNPLDPYPPYEVASGYENVIPQGFNQPDAINTPALLSARWTSPYSETTTDLAWGDYDNDGDLDLAVANSSTGPNRLFRNDNGTLTFVSSDFNCLSTNENTTFVSWYDYDRDGYLDISFGNQSGRNCFYNNNGNGTFTKDWTAQASQNTRSVAWAGWTRSGGFSPYLAIGNYGQASAIYMRDAGQMYPYTFPAIHATTNLVWGDFDNDGDPDLAMGNFGEPTIIYRNDVPPAGTRVRFTAVATITLDASNNYFTNDVSWGDVNGDGYLDLALGNGTESGETHKDKVFCNSGPSGYTFSDCWTSNDTSVTSAIDWGDYDGDGDLDLAATSEAEGGVTRIYVNNGGTLSTQAGTNTFDDSTLAGTAVAWADLDGDGDLDFSIGYDGTDTFATPSVHLFTNSGGSFAPQNLANSGNDTRAITWGDVDDDGYLDLALANSGSPVKVYRSNGTDLAEYWAAPTSANTRGVAWGDYDRDGDLDLAVGNGQDGSGAFNLVYRNTGSTLSGNAYIEDINPSNTTAVAWGDINGDGTLDLIEANYETSQPNRIFWNIWNPFAHSYQFTQTLGFGLSSDRSTSLAVGDFDQDYDLDILIGNDGQVDRVYVNNGTGNFTTLNLPAPSGVCATNKTRSVAWADFDGDGDLDIAQALDGCVRVLQANASGGAWSFAQAWTDSGSSLLANSISWGDFDGDGDPDLAVGLTGQFGLKSRIYRNNGSSFGLHWVADLEQTARTLAVAWGDVDNDGDLDLAIGNDLTNATPDRLYINTILASTHAANDPISTYVYRPDGDVQASGMYFSAGRVLGDPVIGIPYTLVDEQADRAFLVQHQVSWDGGHRWEAAWEFGGSHSGEWVNISSSRTGSQHSFPWDALNQFLSHQGLSIPVPAGQTMQEMDLAFRVVAWAHNEHGGPIQRPRFGGYTSMMRADMRPDWFDSAKTFVGEIPEVVHPDEIVNLTIEITQTDHGMPWNAYILDRLPPQLYFEDYGTAWMEGGSSPYYTEITSSLTTVTWTGALEYDYHPSYPHVYSIYFSPRVVRPLPNGSYVTNCAEIFDGLHAAFNRCLTFEISSTPKTDESWKLVNGVTTTISLPGDLLTYTLHLTNTGTDNAHNVLVTDVLSADLVWQDFLQATSGQASYADGVVSWTGEINVFEPVVVTYTARVANPLPGNTLITNTFHLQDNINPVYAAPPVTTTVLAPDLRASTKDDTPDEVQLGDPVNYTIFLRNHGGLDALPAYFWDPIPAGSSYLTNTLQVSPVRPGDVYGYDPIEDQIYWRGDMRMTDEIRITFGITAGLQLSTDGILTNTAYITDVIGGPVSIVATTTVRLPDLNGSYKIVNPTTAQRGDTLDYTILISNTNAYAPGVTATDPIPAGGSAYVENSLTSSDGNASYNAGQNAIVWGNTLQSDDTATFSYQVTAGCPNVEATSMLSNVVYIREPTGLIIERTALTFIEIANLTTSSIESDVTQAKPGDVIEYTIVIRNTGLLGNDLWMNDILPVELEWIDVYEASTGSISYNPAQRLLHWEGTLDNGQQAVITFQARVRANMIRDEITNEAIIWNGCYQQSFGAMPIAILDESNNIYLPVIMR